MTNLDSIFKSRDITLLTKICLIKAMVFPVVMYGCESWTIKKVPWTARRSNQSILKEISPECSLEGLMTQRDGMGREVGEGFRMGNMCTPVMIYVDVRQNQYNIVK